MQQGTFTLSLKAPGRQVGCLSGACGALWSTGEAALDEPSNRVGSRDPFLFGVGVDCREKIGREFDQNGRIAPARFRRPAAASFRFFHFLHMP